MRFCVRSTISNNSYDRVRTTGVQRTSRNVRTSRSRMLFRGRDGKCYGIGVGSADIGIRTFLAFSAAMRAAFTGARRSEEKPPHILELLWSCELHAVQMTTSPEKVSMCVCSDSCSSSLMTKTVRWSDSRLLQTSLRSLVRLQPPFPECE